MDQLQLEAVIAAARVLRRIQRQGLDEHPGYCGVKGCNICDARAAYTALWSAFDEVHTAAEGWTESGEL